MRPNQGNDLQNAAITAIAAASKTPFRTAFKISMGIALAQITTLIFVLFSFALLVGVITFFLGSK